MYYLTTEDHFDAAHFLKNYDGPCQNIHGHRWRVVVHIRSKDLSTDPQTEGMVADFSDVKRMLSAHCAQFDHSFIFESGSLRPATESALHAEGFRLVTVPFRPTAEHFARHFYECLQADGLSVCRVDVYETPKNLASYEA